MKKQERYILFFLFLILLAVRLYHLDTPPLENEESWRQADTESMAWNFVSYDFNPLRPNLNYDGPLPNIPALELQVTTFLIALLYKIFGHHYILARLVPIMFFLLSAYYLYRFARLHMNRRGAALSLLIYGILPINVYYSRAIMPESAALMFWLAGLYYFNCWIKENTRKKDTSAFKLAVSAACLSLAIMTKPPVVFVAIPMLFMCFNAWGWGWVRMPALWGYALAILAIPAIYYYISTNLADYTYTLGIANIIGKQTLTAFYSPEALSFFRESIPKIVGKTGILLVLMGIISAAKKQTVIVIWFLAMVLEVILIVSPIRALYYLIFLTVPCALLIGNLAGRLPKYFSGIISLAIIVVIAYNSWQQVKPMYTINETMQTQVKVVRELTAKDDLLVVASFDPCLLSLADRRGWRYNLGIYSFIPEDPYKELAYYRERGAKYFVPIQGKVYGDEDDKLMNYIEKSYPKIETVEGYPIYDLR